jgi:MscS family membrane protein
MEFLDQVPFFNQFPPGTQRLMLRLLALAVALVFLWVLRGVVTRMIMSPVKRLVGRTSSKMDDAIFNAIQRPMRLIVLAIGVAIVAELFSFDTELSEFAASLTGALVIGAVTFFIYNLIGIVGIDADTFRGVTGLVIQERLLPFMVVVLKVFTVVMGLFLVLTEFGYNVSGLIASFGVVGLAFSLAAQDTAANIFGFTAIVSDNPFKVGDYIVTGDFSGIVEHVGVRSTRVRKLDQSLVTVPNSNLTDSAVTNWSRLDRRRMDFHIGVTYNTTSDRMRELLQGLRDLLRERDPVDEETVQVFFVEFGDSALQIRLIAYINLADWGEFHGELELINLAIMELVESLGLSMAFPSRSLYVESLPQADTRESDSRELVANRPLPGPPPQSEPQGRSEAKYQDNEAASSDSDADER